MVRAATFLLIAMAGCAALQDDGASTERGSPNIVLFLVDDLGWQDTSLPLHGAPTPLNQRYRTPHLEQLAADGVRFTNAYASAPVCTPTRTSIMTGQSPARSHITYWTLHRDRDTSTKRDDLAPPQWRLNGLDAESVTLPQLLQQAGYRTIHVGKAHFGTHGTSGSDPRNLGFDVNVTGSGSGAPASYYGEHNFSRAGRQGKDPSESSVWDVHGLDEYHDQDCYLTDVLVREAKTAVRQAATDGKPFFLNFAPYAVHTPIMAHSKYVENYGDLDPREAAYASMIEAVDDALGELRALLEELGVADDTVIIFTSDNGGLSAHARGRAPDGATAHSHNAPLRSGKGSAYEGGTRVPAVVHWPGVSKPALAVHDPIISHDLFPTILGMAEVPMGAAVAQEVDGVDIGPALLGNPLPVRPLVWSQPHQWGARGPGIEPFTSLRYGNWKLIYFHPDRRFELYDLQADIGEQRDLFGEKLSTARELAMMLDVCLRERGAQLSIDKSTGEPIPGPGVSIERFDDPQAEPFGPKHPHLDGAATGEWWTKKVVTEKKAPVHVDVPRDEVIAFALYTHDEGVLKLSAQLYPLYPDEEREVRLELLLGTWREVERRVVVYPGWSAHFRLTDWNPKRSVRYRLRHGDNAVFEGVIRRDPIDKNEIVVASLSCNSSRTKGPRPRIVENLRLQDPDLLFFAGDQTYHHRQHTAGWIEFGLQFREILRNRPVVAIPDDHDIGQSNLWGEYGKKASTGAGPDGGYFFPALYVNMVQRQQTWHLPDPHRTTPIERGIKTYYTRLRVGGIDFAILEDRKFKSGPEGKIPQMGPRPDHINDLSYDRDSIDVPGLRLLGPEQLAFLNEWSQDWSGAQMKCVLSQTAFCGAVHLHGTPGNRLLADLDCNGWPQTGRRQALREIRRAWAPHLCGDQHLAVVVQHGIDDFRDGPFGFTTPAIVNTIYGRWWHPLDEQSGARPIQSSGLPWTGDYLDGIGNHLTMHAYANPTDRTDPKQRADGYGLIRFDKGKRTITFECWPRFADVAAGDAQFPGWPITIAMADNDGRRATHWLPRIEFKGVYDPVLQVIEDRTGEVLYTIRVRGTQFQPHVYAPGTYTVRWGKDQPSSVVLKNAEAGEREAVGVWHVQFSAASPR